MSFGSLCVLDTFSVCEWMNCQPLEDPILSSIDSYRPSFGHPEVPDRTRERWTTDLYLQLHYSYIVNIVRQLIYFLITFTLPFWTLWEFNTPPATAIRKPMVGPDTRFLCFSHTRLSSILEIGLWSEYHDFLPPRFSGSNLWFAAVNVQQFLKSFWDHFGPWWWYF